MINRRETTRGQALTSSDVVLAVLMVLLCLISVRLVLYWQDSKSVREEIGQWSGMMVQTSDEGLVEETTQLEDLLVVVDECAEIFKHENIGIRSYNLEEISEEGEGQAYLQSALIRFKVLGSWEGIERGLSRIEGIPNRGIHVEEAILGQGGGEILLKIFFIGK